MASKKIQDNIDTGLRNRCFLGLTASAFWDLGGDGGQYRINYHLDDMPAHKSVSFGTLEELEVRMRQFEPDLRKWRTAI